MVKLEKRRHILTSVGIQSVEWGGEELGGVRDRETDLQVGRQSHVNLLPVRGDSVQQQRVVQRAVPHGLEAIEGPRREGEIF